MKKIILTTMVIVLLAGFASGQVRLSFKASGGIANIANTDWNNGTTGLNEEFSHTMQNVSGSFSTFNQGMNFAGEMLVMFNGQFGIGFGAGYMHMSVRDDVTYYSPKDSLNYEWVRNPQVSVIPLVVNLHFRTPVSWGVHFTASAGVGYYLGKFSKNDSYTYTGGSETQNFGANNNALGFQGALGFEYALGHKFFLTVEGGYRIAKLTEVTGSFSQIQTGESDINETRTMWIADYYLPKYGVTCTRTTFATAQPANANASNVRKAEIDLSGYSAIVGLRFVF